MATIVNIPSRVMPVLRDYSVSSATLHTFVSTRKQRQDDLRRLNGALVVLTDQRAKVQEIIDALAGSTPGATTTLPAANIGEA